MTNLFFRIKLAKVLKQTAETKYDLRWQTMETEYAAVPCDSLIPAFSFPIEDKIVIKIFEKTVCLYI